MEFHVCTFEIKLQYVKRQGQNKWGNNPIEALWKSAKQQIIAVSNSHHTFKNGTAWFNEIFEIKTDLLYDSRRKKYEKLPIYLEIKEMNQTSGLHQTLAVDLGQVAIKKIVPQKQYEIKSQNSLVVCLLKHCSNVQTAKNNLLKKNVKSESKYINKLGNIQFFLQKQKKNVDKENQKRTDQKLIQVPHLSKKIETEIMRTQSQEKSKGVSMPQQQAPQASQITQMSNQLFQMQNKLEKLHVRNHKVKQQFESISTQLAQAEKQCAILSAEVCQRETIIFELNNQISALKQKNRQFVQRIVNLQSLQTKRLNLQIQVADLQQLIKDYKQKEIKFTSNEIQLKRQLQNYKNDLIGNNNIIISLKKQIQEINITKNKNEAMVQGLEEENQNIKRQVSKWRNQWAIEHQQTKEQLNNCEIQYTKLLQKYTQLRQKYKESNQKKISQQLFNATVEQQKRKVAQLQQKYAIFKQQFVVIEEEIQNLHQLLEDKEENEQQLLDHIKKLQHDLQSMQLQSQWWDQAICKEIQLLKNSEENERDEQMKKLKERNRQLMQLLQQNSFIILNSEKINRQLVRVQTQNEQWQKRQATMHEEMKQLKQRIAILLKQSKKLQDKNSKLGKQKEALSQKNSWLNDELINNCNNLKQKNDFIEALTFRLSQCEKQISTFKKQKQIKKISKEHQENHISEIGVQYQQDIIKQNQNLQKDYSLYQLSNLSNLRNFDVSKTINQFSNQKNSKILEAINGLSQTIEDRIIDSDNFQIGFLKMKQISPQKYFHQKLNKQIQKMQKTSNKVKIQLLKNGLIQLFKEWQQNIQILRNQTDKMIISQ